MEHTFEDLKQKTVAQLREIAEGIESDAVVGFKSMHKEKLLEAVCKALGIDTRVHHKVVGVNKSEIKTQIRTLKAERAAAIEAHDHKQLKAIRRKIHTYKRKIKKATV